MSLPSPHFPSESSTGRRRRWVGQAHGSPRPLAASVEAPSSQQEAARSGGPGKQAGRGGAPHTPRSQRRGQPEAAWKRQPGRRGPAVLRASTAAGPSSPSTPSSPWGPLQGQSLGDQASRPDPRDQPRAFYSFCQPEQPPTPHFQAQRGPLRPTPWAGGGRAGQTGRGGGVEKAGQSEDGVLRLPPRTAQHASTGAPQSRRPKNSEVLPRNRHMFGVKVGRWGGPPGKRKRGKRQPAAGGSHVGPGTPGRPTPGGGSFGEEQVGAAAARRALTGGHPLSTNEDGEKSPRVQSPRARLRQTKPGPKRDGPVAGGGQGGRDGGPVGVDSTLPEALLTELSRWTTSWPGPAGRPGRRRAPPPGSVCLCSAAASGS